MIDAKRLRFVDGLSFQCDQIRNSHVIRLAVETEYRLDAGICDLCRIVGQLDLRNDLTVYDLCGHLVDTAERGIVLACDELCSDAP